MTRTICYQWGSTDILWKNADWTWSECKLVEEIITGVDATTLIPPWLEEPWNPYRAAEEEQKKRQKFIQLLAKVKGYPEYEKKGILKENIKITVDDVKLVVKEVAGIDLIIKKEKVNYGILPIHRQK